MGKGIGQAVPGGCWGKCNCPQPGYVVLPLNGILNEIQADPANRTLERAYKITHDKNAVLTDSDLDKGNLGTMPAKGSLPKHEWDFFQNEFLPAFRGVRNRLRPDIMDFSAKVMYEIKTQASRKEGHTQILQDYRLAKEVCESSHMDIHFQRAKARWRHCHIYPLGPNMYICCGLTDYNKVNEIDGKREDEAGLIIYRIFVRKNKVDEESKRAKDLQDYRDRNRNSGKRRKKKVRSPAGERVPEIPREVWIRMEQEMDRALGGQDEGEKFVILAPKAFYHQFVELPRMNAKIRMMQVKGADARTNPVMAFRDLNMAIGVIIAAAGVAATLIVVCVYFAPVAAGTMMAQAPNAAMLTNAAAAGVGATATAQPLLINAARLVAANDNAQKIIKSAAAVLILVATVKDAQANQTVEEVDAVIAVPASQFTLTDGDEGVYNGKKYYWIANAYATGD